MSHPPASQPDEHTVHPVYRPDIDGLRAVAILSVVIFHAFPFRLPGGFVGVDVFFVISGFLISTIIFRSLQRGDFSFAEFYARRIKRIFPALIVVLMACYAFGWFALLPDEFKQLGKHMAAGAGFAQNFILWHEVGYFDTAAELKPLLHLWSLAIEEQFYLIFPVLIVAVWRIGLNVLTVVLLLALISFALNISEVTSNPTKIFFMPQTRVWELLAGSVLAYLQFFKRAKFYAWMQRWKPHPMLFSYPTQPNRCVELLNNALSVVGLVLLLVAVFFITKSKPFPGWWALLPVSGAFLLILSGPDAWVNRIILASKLMVFVGLISYPLFLWHRPILTFAQIVESEMPSREIRTGAVALSFILAWVTYRLIEKPIRFGSRSHGITFTLIATLLVVGYVGFEAFDRGGLAFRQLAKTKQNIQKNFSWDGLWKNSSCFEKYKVEPCVQSGDRPDIIVIGDSHANHLYPGLASLEGHTILNIGTCTPIEGIEGKVDVELPTHECRRDDHLGKNLHIAQTLKTLRVAIISAWWEPVLSGAYRNPVHEKMFPHLRLYSKYPNEAGLSNSDLVRAGLSRTLTSLQHSGLSLLFVRDVPVLTSNLLEYCKLRSTLMANNCTIPKSVFVQSRRLEDGLIEYLKTKYPSLRVVDPINDFCDESECYLMRNGILFYRDDNHLSIDGSRAMGALIQRHLDAANSN
jgi:peptidoglycan/LPS O-acetylase OafA/YrhL